MRTPQSIMTVAEFVERRFLPEHVAMLKASGRTHYNSNLPHVLEGIPERRRSFKGRKMVKGKWAEDEQPIPRRFGIGGMRLRDVGNEEAQRLVSEALCRGYSVQSAKHIKNVISGIFTFAEEKGWFSGRNPAYFVRLPEMERVRPVYALSFDELKQLLGLLGAMPRAMLLCASLTSMNIAEVCGLRWKRVNLTDAPVIVDGESIPAFHLAVREHWYLRQWTTTKAPSRRRNIPIASVLAEALAILKSESRPKNLDEPVFVGKDGRNPRDQQSMLNRRVRPASAAIGYPKLGWHDLRRTFATLADQLNLTIGERQALMGHARAAQTLDYTHTHSSRAVAALELFAERVKGPVQ
jgi:integrase/recombinase XerC